MKKNYILKWQEGAGFVERIFIICYFWSDLIHEAETWLVVNVLLASFSISWNLSSKNVK